MNVLNIECPTHGQPENSCAECKDNERKIIEGKSIRQQIEESERKPYDGILTEKMLLEFLEDLNTKKPYKDPTEGMSEKMAIAFNEAQKEYVKRNY